MKAVKFTAWAVVVLLLLLILLGRTDLIWLIPGTIEEVLRALFG